MKRAVPLGVALALAAAALSIHLVSAGGTTPRSGRVAVTNARGAPRGSLVRGRSLAGAGRAVTLELPASAPLIGSLGAVAVPVAVPDVPVVDVPGQRQSTGSSRSAARASKPVTSSARRRFVCTTCTRGWSVRSNRERSLQRGVRTVRSRTCEVSLRITLRTRRTCATSSFAGRAIRSRSCGRRRPVVTSSSGGRAEHWSLPNRRRAAARISWPSRVLVNRVLWR